MENYKLQEEVQALKALVTQYKEGLRRFGVEVNSLPEDLKTMLEKCIDTQTVTGLHNMDELYLKEFYLQKRKEQVDNKLAANKMQAEIDNLKKQIQRKTAECDMLERFVNQPVTSEKDSRMAASLLGTKIENLQSKQSQIPLPENLDIDELIKKVEILKARESEGKK